MSGRIRREFILVILALAGMSLGGCTSYRSPSIQLVDVRMVDRSDEAAAFHFDFDLENPNEEPIELREFRYTLSVDGTRVYEGRRAASTTLQPGTTNRVELPAAIRYALVNWQASTLPESVEYRLTGTLVYVTPGELAEVLLDTGVRRPTASFSTAGRLTFAAGP